MATSSSAKKVARVAAKSGSVDSGTPKGAGSKNWIFALAVVAIVGLGIGIVLFARSENTGLGDNSVPPKANLQDGNPSDHWHAAFAVSVCGSEIAPLQDNATDPLGIHTHGDGLIHIHPFTRAAAGERATLGKYFPQVNLKVTDQGFQLPDGVATDDGGTTVEEGVTTCGGKEGELVLAHWADATAAANTEPDKIFRSDFANVPFSEDRGAYTLAFVAKGSTDIAAPSTAAEIDTLGSADGGAAPTGAGSDPASTPTNTDITVPVAGG